MVIAGEMMWLTGSNNTNPCGNYGEKGKGNTTNVPGGRHSFASWIDSFNNLYLFGGVGYTHSAGPDHLNDLWKFDGTNWTWISGSDEHNQKGKYGTIGVPNPDNVPGARTGAVSWIDSENKLYLFGGEGYAEDSFGSLNDLWIFNGYWAWISGSTGSYNMGSYGTKGDPHADNVPGARSYAFSWIDSFDNLYLFGGDGIDHIGYRGYLNDLWKFDGVYWVWISGSKERSQSGNYGKKGVPHPDNVPGARAYGVSWIDSKNNLYLFGGFGHAEESSGYLNDLWKFDGTNWVWLSGSNRTGQHGVYGTKGVPHPNNVPGARQYAISWIDSLDNLYLFGGSGYTESSEGYLNDLWKFDGTNWVWIHGSKETNSPGNFGEKGVPNKNNFPTSREHSSSWIDASNNLYLFGGYGCDNSYDCANPGLLNDLWKFIPTCFNFSQNDSQVCSGRGECIGDNYCKCIADWYGEQCNYRKCFGVIGNESHVCSGHGTCIDIDTCNCTAGWEGVNCNLTNCFGIIHTNASVCSGHGECVSLNNCSCLNGYGAEKCQFPICNGKLSNDSTVCNSRGTCLSPNNCNCTDFAKWTGSDCQIPICFSKPASYSLVCSGHGQCVSPNNCSCLNGYTSYECQIAICNGKLSNDSTVCNSRGNCSSPNNCICTDSTNWTGSDCEIPICFSKSAIDSKVCSGNGKCISPNNCTCNENWFSKECNITTCHGIRSDNITVCSGHGVCIRPNNCSCHDGYTGDNCSVRRKDERNYSWLWYLSLLIIPVIAIAAIIIIILTIVILRRRNKVQDASALAVPSLKTKSFLT